MQATEVVKLLVLLTQLSQQLPTLIASVRTALSSDVTEAELQAELTRLRASNESAYDAAVAALKRHVQA